MGPLGINSSDGGFGSQGYSALVIRLHWKGGFSHLMYVHMLVYFLHFVEKMTGLSKSKIPAQVVSNIGSVIQQYLTENL